MILRPVDGAAASPVGRDSHDYYDHSALTVLDQTFYLPYSRVHVSVSSGFPKGLGFLDHRPAGDIGWYLLTQSTVVVRVFLRFPRSDLLFCVTLDVCLSTEHSNGLRKANDPFPQSSHYVGGACTILVKPIILRWLVPRLRWFLHTFIHVSG